MSYERMLENISMVKEHMVLGDILSVVTNLL